MDTQTTATNGHKVKTSINEKTPVIQKSYNYGMFKFLKENRPVNKSKVERIAQSIKKDDQSPWRPVLVDANFGIIDGQHQFKTLEKLGYPIYFVQNPDAKLGAIALLNAFTSTWGMMNYAHFYAKQGFKAYSETITFAQKHHLTISLAIGFLTLTFKDLGIIRADFRNGLFIITQREGAEKLLDEIGQIRQYLVGVEGDRDFYHAYVTMRKQVDFLILKETLEKKPLKIEARSNKRDYLREFEDILNYEKQKNLIRLF